MDSTDIGRPAERQAGLSTVQAWTGSIAAEQRALHLALPCLFALQSHLRLLPYQNSLTCGLVHPKLCLLTAGCAIRCGPIGGSRCFFWWIQASNRTMKRWQIMWEVRALALRWVAIEHRRQARRRDYRQIYDSLTLDEDRVGIEVCMAALDEASSMEVTF